MAGVENVGRCGSCRHWTQHHRESEFDEPYDWDMMTEDQRAVWLRQGKCALFRSDDGKPIDPAALAFARDYESYKAEFVSRDDFGCIQWIEKENR